MAYGARPFDESAAAAAAATRRQNEIEIRVDRSVAKIFNNTTIDRRNTMRLAEHSSRYLVVPTYDVMLHTAV